MDYRKEFEEQLSEPLKTLISSSRTLYGQKYIKYLESQLTASRQKNEEAERILKSLIDGEITDDDVQWAKHIINKRESE